MRQAIYDRRFNRASGTTRLSDFVDKVFIPYAAEKRSFKDDQQRAGGVKEFFRGRQVRDVTPMLIEKFESDLRKRTTKFGREMSPATVNRHLQVLSKVLSLAYDNGLIDSNPVSRVRRLREPPPRERHLTGEEEERLFAALRPYGERIEALAALGLDTGLRLSELLRLRRRRSSANSPGSWRRGRRVTPDRLRTGCIAKTASGQICLAEPISQAATPNRFCTNFACPIASFAFGGAVPASRGSAA
jgi:integrase